MEGLGKLDEILKEGLLNQFTFTEQPLTLSRVVVALLITFLVGLFIYFVYRRTFKGVLYTKSFNVSLIMTALVTTLIIMPINSNITLSLGMVGALSIVRFRAAIKDPIDIVYMFWAIAVGVASGAGFYVVAVGGSLVIGLLLFAIKLTDFRLNEPYLLIVHCDTGKEDLIRRVLPRHRLRSQTVSDEGTELILELRIKGDDTSFVNELLLFSEVADAALVSYSGDFITR